MKFNNRDKQTKILLVCILLLALFLRFWNLNKTPGWFPDEGVDLNLAWNLIHGKGQLFSTVYPFVPHPPLYYFLSGLFLLIFGKSIFVLRLFSALCSLGIIYLLYLIGAKLENKKAGLLAAFLFTIYPLVIISGRYGLSYHFFELLLTLSLYFLACFSKENKSQDLLKSALFAGLSVVTSYFGFGMVLVICLVALLKAKKQIIPVLGLALGPFVLYVITGLILDSLHFSQAVAFMFSRKDFAKKPLEQLLASYRFFKEDFLIPVGAAGLLFLPGPIKWWALLAFLGTSTFEFIFRGFWRYISSYLFLSMLGGGFLFDWCFRVVGKEFGKHQRWGYFCAFFIFFLCVGWGYLVPDLKTVYSGQWFGLFEEKSYSPNSFSDLADVVAYINQKTNPEDVVLISPHLAWLIKSRTSDPFQAYIYTDRGTFNFPNNMKKYHWFYYDPSLENAKFVLKDKFLDWFACEKPVKKEILSRIYQSWPVVYRKGEFTVYRNPRQ